MNESIEETGKPYKPSYWKIYFTMVLSSWWDVARYVFAIRRPDQHPDDKKFGLLMTIVSEFAKIVGSLATIVVASIAVVILGGIWPVITPVIDLFLAYIVLSRVKRQTAESAANSAKLAEEIAE